jgi:hypothetical protein
VRLFGIPIRVIVSLAITIHFLTQCSTKPNVDSCDHKYGQTTLKGRVLDFYTSKPIDSVQINIVWNSSWDHLLDTLVKQNDSLSFVFNAPDECEPYFFTLSNKHYWADLENHPAYKVSIDKGTVNNFEIHLRPATFFRINVTRDTLDNKPDTVLLEIRKANTKDWKRWTEISAKDFSNITSSDVPTTYVLCDSGTQRTISAYYDIESNINYDVRWTRRGTKSLDTLHYHFTAEPFDTVQLDYRFRKH